jgi:peroxidase
LLSLLLVRDLDVPSDTDTTFVMQYGQFVDRKCI